jgi:site-specific DNA recombinase
VKALLSDPAVLRRQDEHGRGAPAVDVRAEQERARLERQLATRDREVTRLLDAYQAEVIDLNDLAERRRRLDDHGRMLRERVRAIAQQRTERTAELRLLEGVEAFCTSIREAMEEPSFTVQQKVLQLVVNRIVVEDSQVLIEHVVPTGPVRLQPEQQPCENLR